MPTPPRRSPRAAGVLLTLLPLAGLLVGTVLREPSIGLVTGIAAAVLLVAGFWLVERR